MQASSSVDHDPVLTDMLGTLKILDRYLKMPYLVNISNLCSHYLGELYAQLLQVQSSYHELISSWAANNIPVYQQLWDMLFTDTFETIDKLSAIKLCYVVDQDNMFDVEAAKDLQVAVRIIISFVDCYQMSPTLCACVYLKTLSAEQLEICLRKLRATISHYHFRARSEYALATSSDYHSRKKQENILFILRRPYFITLDHDHSEPRSENDCDSIWKRFRFMESILSPPHYSTLLGARGDHEAPNDLLDDIEFLLRKAWEAIINCSISSSHYCKGLNRAFKLISIAIYAQVSINERRKSGGNSEETVVPSQHQKRGASLSWIDEIGVNFCDCILEIMLEILQEDSCLLVQWNNQTKALHKQLRFLKYFLTDPPVEFTRQGNWSDLSNTIKVTISRQVTPLILSNYYGNNYYQICKDANNVMRKTIEVINLFERETFSHRPRTDDEFGSVDYFLEKLEILISHSMLSSLHNVKKQHLEKALEELTSLHAHIYRICKKGKIYMKLKTQSSQIGDVASAMSYIVRSLVDGSCPVSHLTQWFSDLEKETKLIKKKVNAISGKNRSSDRDHNFERLSNYKLSQGNDPKIDEEIVGFVEEEMKVIELLVRGSEYMQRVLISGMPGLGKTTLAKKVYHNQIVVDHFCVRSWCCVSQGYQRKDLLVQILNHITPIEESMDENILAEILQKELKQRRYLIVMDDIWDKKAWDEIRMCFPDNKDGSRILLTSRFNDLPFESTTKIHILNPLSDEESWELLGKKLQFTGNCPPEVLEIGVTIAKGCKGVPLVVVLVAGLVADMNPDQWQQVASNVTSFVVNDSQRQCADILEMSYNNLPYYLKPCFLYLGCFPPNFEISSTKLIQLWIAEGYIKKRVSNHLECIAEGYLMDLIQRNLIQVTERRSLGGIKTCRVHDLIHDFCSSKGKGKFVQQTIDASGAAGKQTLRGQEPVDWSSYVDVRSLSLYCNIKNDSIKYIFENFKLLRVLDLMTPCLMWEIIDLPDSIGLLEHLRFLAGPFSSIPSSVYNLTYLVTFRMVVLQTDVIYLPSSFRSLGRLRHLHISCGTIFRTQQSDPVSLFYNFQTVSTLILPEFGGRLLTSFPSLRKLKCLFVNIQERVTNPEFNLLTRLESLEMTYLLGDWPETSPLYTNWQFSFPPTIRKLTLKMFCLPWSEMSIFEELPNLEVLKLDRCSFVGRKWNMGDVVFDKLKYLRLRGLNLVRWSASPDNFPCLENLVVQGCKYLKEIPAEFNDCYTLKMIEVSGCEFSVEKSARKINKEQLEYGNEELKILARDNDPNKAYLWSGTVRKKLSSKVL